MKWIFAHIAIFLFAGFNFYAGDKQMTNSEVAIFGGGCFWCIEAVFDRVEGVYKAESGYAAGQTKDPDYRSVCSGLTGHAEVVRIEFDPNKVSYRELLNIFFTIHDPTQLNRQGNDVGTQYRSIIIYQNDEQKKIAGDYKSVYNKVNKDEPMVTEIVPDTKFFIAEAYHQNYFDQNPGQGYCQAVIAPKVRKFIDTFGSKVKK